MPELSNSTGLKKTTKNKENVWRHHTWRTIYHWNENVDFLCIENMKRTVGIELCRDVYVATYYFLWTLILNAPSLKGKRPGKAVEL